eukprot:362094-Chlamydomonas_euryale.AAC.15
MARNPSANAAATFTATSIATCIEKDADLRRRSAAGLYALRRRPAPAHPGFAGRAAAADVASAVAASSDAHSSAVSCGSAAGCTSSCLVARAAAAPQSCHRGFFVACQLWLAAPATAAPPLSARPNFAASSALRANPRTVPKPLLAGEHPTAAALANGLGSGCAPGTGAVDGKG